MGSLIDLIRRSFLRGRAQELVSLQLPSYRIVSKTASRVQPIGASKLYGNPDLPESTPWPDWMTHSDRFLDADPQTNVPRRLPPGLESLSFIAQINLSELPPMPQGNPLPPAGLLSFFYARRSSPWGFDPKDALAWRVIWSPSSGLVRRTAPADVVTDPERTIAFQPEYSLPSPGWLGFPQMDDEEMDSYEDEIQRALGAWADGHVLGYPHMLQQNDPREQCQFCSNGLYCGTTAVLSDSRIPALREGVKDWILLLQIWLHDCYINYWIRKQDLADHRFDRMWFKLEAD